MQVDDETGSEIRHALSAGLDPDNRAQLLQQALRAMNARTRAARRAAARNSAPSNEGNPSTPPANDTDSSEYESAAELPSTPVHRTHRSVVTTPERSAPAPSPASRSPFVRAFWRLWSEDSS